jgi:peptidoglycan hydrolase-like protein with peptidoglycan-binding domain
MTAASPAEPDLYPGDHNDAVLHLQTRLHALGYFAGSLDGLFGEDTGAAVGQLREQAGLAGVEGVDQQVWAALAAAEQALGLPHPAPDENWHWDGESWQPRVDAAVAPETGPVAEPHVDHTGQWIWDGTQWQPVAG